MNEYELFDEKRAEFISPFLSDKMLEKGDIITFRGESFVVAELMIPENHKLRVAVWPAKINLPGDFENHRLLHWIQQNLIGMRVRLSDDKNNIEGEVIDLWPGIKSVPSGNHKSGEESEAFQTEDYPDRLEFLILGPDNPEMIDLLDFSIIEILDKSCRTPRE